MENNESQKPSFDEWLGWGRVVIDRLTEAVQVYNRPPHTNESISDKERQLKTVPLLEILRRFHFLTDEGFGFKGRPADDLEKQNERSLAEMQIYSADVLRRLPVVSYDMQKLLKSNWTGPYSSDMAARLFCGPSDQLAEGIGSGKPEDGRLPEILKNLLEREQKGSERSAVSIKPEGDTTRHDQEDIAVRRWVRQNYLRSAGRMD